RVRMFTRDGSNLQCEFGRGGERVPAHSHWGGPGMCLLAVERDRMALDSLGSKHHPKRELHGLEDRPLFDMQLQVGAGLGVFLSRIADPVDVDLALPERVLQADSIAVCPAPVGLNGMCPGKRRGTEQAAAEPRALLV